MSRIKKSKLYEYRNNVYAHGYINPHISRVHFY